MSELSQKIFKGLAWNFSGTAAQAVLQIATLAILARLVAPQQFGLLAASMIMIGFSSIFTQLGIAPAIVRHPNLDSTHVASAGALSLYIGMAFCALLATLASPVESLLNVSGIAPVLRALSLLFVVQALGAISEALLQRELKFSRLAIVEVASYLVGYGGVAVLLAWMGWGVWALVGGHVAQAVLKTGLLSIMRPHERSLRFTWNKVGELLNFGAGFTLAKLFNYAAQQGDNVVVARRLGAVSLGFYTQAYQFIVMPANLFGAVLDRVMFPAMASVQDEPVRLAEVYRQSVAACLLLTVPISIGVAVLAPELVLVLLGTKWLAVVAPLQVLALGLSFRTTYKMSDSLARAKGAVYRRAWRQGVYAAMVVLGSWIGHHWGILGVAWGVTAAILINYILMADLSLRLVPLGFPAFISAHRCVLVLFPVVALPSYVVATWLRAHEFNVFATAIIASTTVAVTTIATIAVAPRMVLGADAIRWGTTLQRLRARRDPLRRVAENGG